MDLDGRIGLSREGTMAVGRRLAVDGASWVTTQGETIVLRPDIGAGPGVEAIGLALCIGRSVVVEDRPADDPISVTVTAAQAYGGCSVLVTGTAGPVRVDLPPGFGGGIVRVPNHGRPIGALRRADLMVVIEVRWPPPGNTRLQRALAGLRQQDPRRQLERSMRRSRR